jgi:hypothetical protein
MALLDFTGLELGTGEPLFNGSGGFSIQSAIKKTGTYALKCLSAGSGGDAWVLWGKVNADGAFEFADIENTCVSFDYYCAVGASTADERIYVAGYRSGAAKLDVRRSDIGYVTVYDTNGTLVGTSTNTLSTDTWYNIGVKSGSGTNAPFEVWINGFLEVDGTCDQLAVYNDQFIFGDFLNVNGNAIEQYYDNIVIDSSDFYFDSVVEILKPTANGYLFESVGGSGAANYTQLEEIPQDGDTSYIEWAGVVAVELEDLTGSPNIVAIKGAGCKRSGSGSPSQSVRVRSGSTNADTNPEAVGGSYQYRQKICETDPDTGIAWTVSGVNSAECAVVEAGEAVSVVTQIMLNVLLVPETPGSGGGGVFFRKGFVGEIVKNMYG